MIEAIDQACCSRPLELSRKNWVGQLLELVPKVEVVEFHFWLPFDAL